MVIVDMLSWWYLQGWAWLAHQVFVVTLGKIFRFFSITDLLKTLLAPFRQDFVETKNAPIGIKLQIIGENIISRFFGLIIRTCLIIVGLIAALLVVLGGSLLMLIWPLIPFGFIISILLSVLKVGL